MSSTLTAPTSILFQAPVNRIGGCGVPKPTCPSMRTVPCGRDGTRYAYLGAYVPSDQYTQYACEPVCGPDSLAARSMLSKQERPGTCPSPCGGAPCSGRNPRGIASRDYMMPSLSGMCGGNVGYQTKECGLACSPAKLKDQSCLASGARSPFDDVLLDDSLRDIGMADYAFIDDAPTFITSTYLQSYDLRGDLLPKYESHVQAGASLTSHGPCVATAAWRGYVY